MMPARQYTDRPTTMLGVSTATAPILPFPNMFHPTASASAVPWLHPWMGRLLHLGASPSLRLPGHYYPPFHVEHHCPLQSTSAAVGPQMQRHRHPQPSPTTVGAAAPPMAGATTKATTLFRPWQDDHRRTPVTADGGRAVAAEKQQPTRTGSTAGSEEEVASSVMVEEDPELNRQATLEAITTNLGKTLTGHRCIYCGKEYSRKYGLKIHLRTHTGFKPLRCRVCRRAFGDPSNLNKHTRLHSETAAGSASVHAFKCHLCGKLLVRKRDLERHLVSRHDVFDPPDKCATLAE